jgi:hypothetical protein
MRNISFMLTTEQVKNRTKTVTRRKKWLNLKPGEVLQGCVKCQGLKPGEPLTKLAKVRVVSVRREPLNTITKEDCIAEGFPSFTPAEFVEMFCEHMGGDPWQEVTRIEFEYV